MLHVTHQLGAILWKVPLLYVILLTLMRITGKRQLGTVTSIDLVAFIMMSEAAIVSIADPEIPMLVGVAPVILLGAMEWGFSYLSLKDQRVRRLLEGEPTVVVSHGKIDQGKMAGLRYNLSDLMAEMRGRNVPALADVEFAVLETSGKLTVVPRAGARPLVADDLQTLGVAGAKPGSTMPASELPATLVLDGEVEVAALARIGKDRAWLDEQLQRQGHPPAKDLLVVSADSQARLTTVQPRQTAPARRPEEVAGRR